MWVFMTGAILTILGALWCLCTGFYLKISKRLDEDTEKILESRGAALTGVSFVLKLIAEANDYLGGKVGDMIKALG